jgi:hypothetical protein
MVHKKADEPAYVCYEGLAGAFLYLKSKARTKTTLISSLV